MLFALHIAHSWVVVEMHELDEGTFLIHMASYQRARRRAATKAGSCVRVHVSSSHRKDGSGFGTGCLGLGWEGSMAPYAIVWPELACCFSVRGAMQFYVPVIQKWLELFFFLYFTESFLRKLGNQINIKKKVSHLSEKAQEPELASEPVSWET